MTQLERTDRAMSDNQDAARANVARFTEMAIEAAKRAGATAADTVAVDTESSSASVRLGEVETVKLTKQRRLGLRCFSGQASAVASTADLTEEAIERFAAEVVEMARVVAADPHSGLPDSADLATDLPQLGLAAPEGLSLSPQKRIDLARRCEETALAQDPRLENSEGADFGIGAGSVAYASSDGFRGSYSSTTYSISVAPVASDAGTMQRDAWWDTARDLSQLASPEEVGRIAAERTLRRLGARPVKTRTVPVVFDPQMAASLIGHLAGAVSGGALYRRASFLLGRLNETVAAAGIHIYDDACMVGALGSRPFDGEGLPSRRTTIVEDGVLRSYLLDTYAARKLDMTSTGSASRGVGDSPAASTTNFYLAAGNDTPEDIIASVPDGLYVTGLSGFGVNGVTGDYSRGASGLWIENGKLSHPVEEITIAGNLLQMLQDIEMIGTDLRFRARTSAPTLKIREMTVAGA